MRAYEFIRDLVDFLNQESEHDQMYGVHGDDVNRFKQIKDLESSDEPTEFANTPNEQYADLDSVTVNAGGGANKPKHPSDIRGEHPSMYPSTQWKGR